MNSKKINLQKLVYTAMLAALAGVLMNLEFALPFFPPFYKVDFSDVPSLIALFTMGPLSGLSVEVIKILIKVITTGTNSMYVGEFSNLIGAFMFIFPVWFIMKKTGSTRKGLIISLVISAVIRIAFMCFCNAFITLPMYAAAYGISVNDVVLMVSKVNPGIKDLNSFIILATIPFNIIKLSLNYVIGMFLYVRLRTILPTLFEGKSSLA